MCILRLSILPSNGPECVPLAKGKGEREKVYDRVSSVTKVSGLCRRVGKDFLMRGLCSLEGKPH